MLDRNDPHRTVVVGSGLAATAAINALLEAGIKPLVLDVGKRLCESKQQVADQLRQCSPLEWSQEQKRKVFFNPTLNDGKAEVRKLELGSDYFYSSEHPDHFPPSSHAFGGFSQGWGSASLPAADCDMLDWPIQQRDLLPHYRAILSRLPYSAADDGLSGFFPLLKANPFPLQLAESDRVLLSTLQHRQERLNKLHAVVGQARSLVASEPTAWSNGCQYCGACMSGCVYKAIYKASYTLDALRHTGKIDYCDGVTVKTVKQQGDQVTVCFVDSEGHHDFVTCQRVYLATGALNSAKIIMASKEMLGQALPVHSTSSFVAPFWRFSRATSSWPKVTTLPGVFIDYLHEGHWAHAQVSSANELVLMKLGLIDQKTISLSAHRSWMARQCYVALCNLSSVHARPGSLVLTGLSSAQGDFTYEPSDNSRFGCSSKAAYRQLKKLMRLARSYPFFPRQGIRVRSYHIGGSLPMRTHPVADNDTNHLGCPRDWNRVHVVDSSVFPSIPATTIGLLAMANARRIVLSSV